MSRTGLIRAISAFALAVFLRQAVAAEADVLVAGVPHVKQKPDFCGEACVEMWLRKLGKDLDQDWVFDQGGVDPLLGRGCRTAELARALGAIGFRTGDVWGRVETAKASAQLDAHWRSLHADLVRGVPSIVCMRCTEDGPEHFRLVLGYRAASDEVVYHEPAEDNGAYRRMKRGEFLDLWPLKYAKDAWTVIRLRLEAQGEIAGRRAEGFTAADYAQHVMKLKPIVPKGFTLVLQPPFVVVGDERPQVVRDRAEHTVKWAVDHLKRAYFEKDPAEIITIWLFRDDASYRKHNAEIFRAKPTTPFGYYSSTHRALIMNIATGGGTLVHEIVHPFMRANFPECPDWFNEGLASLYEQSSERSGRICGLTNWRLAGLQEAIRDGALGSFQELTATSTAQFYGMGSGVNYAQARYLCYYLQEKGLLQAFYRAFREGHGRDPTGYATLKRVLGQEDMDAFQKQWQQWVLTLRFP